VDIETARNWAIAASSVISTASIILVWVKTPGEKMKASIAAVESRVAAVKQDTADAISDVATGVTASIDTLEDGVSEALKGHDRRIQKCEDDMRHLPTKDDLNEVTNALTGVQTQVTIMGKVVDRIDEYLREHR
jgi:hypothetical protein